MADEKSVPLRIGGLRAGTAIIAMETGFNGATFLQLTSHGNAQPPRTTSGAVEDDEDEDDDEEDDGTEFCYV